MSHTRGNPLVPIRPTCGFLTGKFSGLDRMGGYIQNIEKFKKLSTKNIMPIKTVFQKLRNDRLFQIDKS